MRQFERTDGQEDLVYETGSQKRHQVSRGRAGPAQPEPVQRCYTRGPTEVVENYDPKPSAKKVLVLRHEMGV